MGVIFSRLNQLNNNNAVEETEIINNYKYPPKSGKKVEISKKNFCAFTFHILYLQEITSDRHLSWAERDLTSPCPNRTYLAKTVI
jgi:hypothetical protein